MKTWRDKYIAPRFSLNETDLVKKRKIILSYKGA